MKVVLMMLYPTPSLKGVSEEKKQIVKNLYLSNIAEEFIAMQVDLEIPLVISILKQWEVYKGEKNDELDDIGKQ
ncbi:MAG: hypothetical protein WA667_30235 [Candidatus Nitrosopolaris sp.]